MSREIKQTMFTLSEVECLLAQEREPMECGHPRACFIGLAPHEPCDRIGGCLHDLNPPMEKCKCDNHGYCSVCAEREKVREKYDQELIRLAERLHDIGELEIGKTVESVADGLRDLTKDLAASSREEGQPTAEEVKAVSAAIARKAIGKLQPAAKDLEEYVKNLPLSEIARIKGIPGVAKLGKTYDRPDFNCAEDE
jgi:hypothetical protein